MLLGELVRAIALTEAPVPDQGPTSVATWLFVSGYVGFAIALVKIQTFRMTLLVFPYAIAGLAITLLVVDTNRFQHLDTFGTAGTVLLPIATTVTAWLAGQAWQTLGSRLSKRAAISGIAAVVAQFIYWTAEHSYGKSFQDMPSVVVQNVVFLLTLWLLVLSIPKKTEAIQPAPNHSAAV
jgi:ABC-type Fe3+-siderophore transport system permease subunit